MHRYLHFFNREKNGWKYDFSDYAPHLILISDNMKINCDASGVVVNYKSEHGWVQISKLTNESCLSILSEQ